MSGAAIATFEADKIGGNARRFHEEFACAPLIVRNVYPAGSALRRLDLDAVERMLGGRSIPVYDSESPGQREVPAEEVLDGVRRGIARHNIVDYHIVGTPLGDIFRPPAFLGENWFLGEPAGCDRMEKSLVLSPAGSFTAIHMDAYAMQGWMYLIEGRKTWTFFPPRHALAAFDPVFREFYDRRRHRPEQFPLLGLADRYTAEMRGGDFLYFPAGWIHEVETIENSFGVGGSLINDHQIEEHMRWWLWERTLHFEGSLDLKRMIQEMPPERFSGPEGMERARAALAFCAAWEARMESLSAQ